MLEKLAFPLLPSHAQTACQVKPFEKFVQNVALTMWADRYLCVCVFREIWLEMCVWC